MSDRHRPPGEADMIRPAEPRDTHALVALGVATGLFTVDDADLLLRQTLDDLHAGRLGPDHVALVQDHEGDGPVAWTYFARDPKADGVWNVWWIGVAPSHHRRGFGTMLLSAIEQAALSAGARLLVIETSSTPELAATRAFYERRRYCVCGQIPDFYGQGDDKITFVKRLAGPHDDADRASRSIQIQRAVAVDVDRIAALAVELARQHQAYNPERFALEAHGHDDVERHATFARMFASALDDLTAVVFVAVEHDRAIGYVFARQEPASLLDLSGAAGWVHDLYVDPSSRGHRVGARLLDAALAVLVERGATRLMLSVAPQNLAARSLFARHGFAITMLECAMGASSPISLP